jgi:hypothetical protein
MDYQHSPSEAKQSYLNSLEEYWQEKVAKIISRKNIGKNFGKALAKLEPEVRAFT